MVLLVTGEGTVTGVSGFLEVEVVVDDAQGSSA